MLAYATGQLTTPGPELLQDMLKTSSNRGFQAWYYKFCDLEEMDEPLANFTDLLRMHYGISEQLDKLDLKDTLFFEK